MFFSVITKKFRFTFSKLCLLLLLTLTSFAADNKKRQSNEVPRLQRLVQFIGKKCENFLLPKTRLPVRDKYHAIPIEKFRSETNFSLNDNASVLRFLNSNTNKMEEIGPEGDLKYISFIPKDLGRRVAGIIRDIYIDDKMTELHVRIEELAENGQTARVYELKAKEVLSAKNSDTAKNTFLKSLSKKEQELFDLFEGNDYRFARTKIHNTSATMMANELEQIYDELANGPDPFAEVRQPVTDGRFYSEMQYDETHIWAIDGRGKFRMALDISGRAKHLALVQGSTLFAAGEMRKRKVYSADGRHIRDRLEVTLDSGTFMRHVRNSPDGVAKLKSINSKLGNAFVILFNINPFVPSSQ